VKTAAPERQLAYPIAKFTPGGADSRSSLEGASDTPIVA